MSNKVNDQQLDQEIQQYAIQLALVGCATFVGIALVQLLVVVLDGFVLQQLWNWFVVPVGFETITLKVAIGIYGLKYFLFDLSTAIQNFSTKSGKAVAKDRLWVSFAFVFLAPIAILLLGHFIYLNFR